MSLHGNIVASFSSHFLCTVNSQEKSNIQKTIPTISGMRNNGLFQEFASRPASWNAKTKRIEAIIKINAPTRSSCRRGLRLDWWS